MSSLTSLLLQEIRRPGMPPRRLRELARDMDLPRQQRGRLEKAADTLAARGDIRRHADGAWSPVGYGLVDGRLDATRQGYAFIAADREGEPDIRVEMEDYGGAFPGDRVRVERFSPSGASSRLPRFQRGRVVAVLERARDRFVAILTPDGRLRPEDPRNPYSFRIAEDDIPAASAPRPASGKRKSKAALPEKPKKTKSAQATRAAQAAQTAPAAAPTGPIKVIAQVKIWPGGGQSAEAAPTAAIVERLGPAGAPDTETAAILARHEAPGDFPAAVKDEVALASRIIPEGERSRRLDLTSWTTCTIDPDDAKDFDDALSIRRRADGSWTVGVHIADVSVWVPPGGAIDAEAQERGTSIYLPGRVIPMLPEELSNDICSLRPGEDRLTKTAMLHFSDEGELLGARLHRSIIHSRRRLTYGQALVLILGQADGPAERDGAVDDECRESVLALHALAQKIRARRMAGGSIELVNAEYAVTIDANGHAAAIVEKTSDVSHQLVEEFMLAANVAVADWAAHNGLGVMHRVHPPPPPANLEALSEFLGASGYPFKLPFQRRKLQDVLDQSIGRPEQSCIHMAVLRSFAPAYYGAEGDLGHFALNFPRYTHFTSPIRRYPDLQLHQQLDAVFTAEADNLPRKLRRAPAVDHQALAFMASHASQRERRAMAIENEVIDFRRLEWLARSGRTDWLGTVTGIKRFGVFVKLDECFVESLLPRFILERRGFEAREEKPPRLSGAKPTMDKKSALRPSRRNKAPGFWLGERVRIRVLSIDLEARECEMDFLGKA